MKYPLILMVFLASCTTYFEDEDLKYCNRFCFPKIEDENYLMAVVAAFQGNGYRIRKIQDRDNLTIFYYDFNYEQKLSSVE